MTPRGRAAAWALGAGLTFGAGMGTGWMLWKPGRMPKPEPPAPTVIQADGSRILERKPDPTAKPAQQVPKGARVERVVQVVVKPNPPADPVLPLPSGSGASAAVDLPRPTLRVDLTLVRLPDQTRRIIASSPDGQVVGGLDIPVEPPPPPTRQLKWAAGAVYGTTAWGDTAKGAFLDRDLAFFRTGAELTRNTYAQANRQGWEFRVRLGIRF